MIGKIKIHYPCDIHNFNGCKLARFDMATLYEKDKIKRVLVLMSNIIIPTGKNNIT